MRVGDVYRINRMLKDGHSSDDIMARFKNDYQDDEIKMFIKAGKDELKPAKPAKTTSKKNQDPLG